MSEDSPKVITMRTREPYQAPQGAAVDHEGPPAEPTVSEGDIALLEHLLSLAKDGSARGFVVVCAMFDDGDPEPIGLDAYVSPEVYDNVGRFVGAMEIQKSALIAEELRWNDAEDFE